MGRVATERAMAPLTTARFLATVQAPHHTGTTLVLVVVVQVAPSILPCPVPPTVEEAQPPWPEAMAVQGTTVAVRGMEAKVAKVYTRLKPNQEQVLVVPHLKPNQEQVLTSSGCIPLMPTGGLCGI